MHRSIAISQNTLTRLSQEIQAFTEEHPRAKGLSKFRQRIKQELAAASLLKEVIGVDNEGQASQKLTNRVQGLVNNCRGLSAELAVARSVPGVTGLSQSFPLTSKGSVQGGRKRQRKSVEVDVVALGGHLWIEVKDMQSFSVGSTRWLGRSMHLAGIRGQAEQQLRAAHLPVNMWRWQPVKVMYHFPSGTDAAVQEELQAMGILVSNGCHISHTTLPKPPPPPQATNLDVTALCALCSEMCNASPSSPGLLAWAQRKPHLGVCLQIEEENPTLAQVGKYLSVDRPLYAATSAIQQFELLLQTFGGPNETARWHVWKPKITAVGACDRDNMPRIADLNGSSTMTKAQQEIFCVGEKMRAVTLTANGHALHSAAAQGVHLEAVIHKAMWLTGL